MSKKCWVSCEHGSTNVMPKSSEYVPGEGLGWRLF